MKKKETEQSIEVLYVFSEDKLKEFKDLPLKSRLLWLEEVNRFINSFLGFKRRALVDRRFIPLAQDN